MIRIAAVTGYTISQLAGITPLPHPPAARDGDAPSSHEMENQVGHLMVLDAYLDDQAIPTPPRQGS